MKAAQAERGLPAIAPAAPPAAPADSGWPRCRLLPRTLAGQLIGLLLAGIVAAHLIALPLGGVGSGSILPAARDQAVERILAAYRAAAACGGCDRAALLSAMASRDADYQLSTAPPDSTATMNEAETALAAELGARTGLPPATAVRVHIEDGAPDTTARVPARRAYAILEVGLRLDDGRWVHASLRPVTRYQWWRPLPISMAVSVLPVLLVVSLFARRILHPTRALAAAAERISRGERIAPLPVSGPAELREVTEAFNAMQQRLTRFIADRTTMLAAIGHDFRTPLAALRLQVELLDDEAARAPMRRLLDDMRDMIDATLRFARDDSVREPTDTIDLAALVARVGGARVALGQAVSWSVPAALAYRCRPQSLARALGNLIDNAVRYGGGARVSVTPPTEARGSLAIIVDDDGPGIPEAWLERVFEPFARPTPERNHDTGGSGLGLAIARSCIAAHGGEIRLANRAQGGLRATVLLPA